MQCNASHEPDIHLLAEVKDVKVVEETSVYVTYRVHIVFRIVNSSKEPAISLAQESVSGVESFAQSREDALSCQYIFDRVHWPSIDRSPKWQTLRKQLDQKSPPEQETRTIAPGAFWLFEKNLDFSIDKKGSWDKTQPLDVLRRQNPLWIQVELMMWPNNLELTFPNLKLGKQLRKRWEANGHFILDNLVSEPTPITLPEK